MLRVQATDFADMVRLLLFSAVAVLHTRVRVRFSGHWKPALNDDQPDSYLALTGKVETRTTSMELPNELAYQSSVLKLFTMFKIKVR